MEILKLMMAVLAEKQKNCRWLTMKYAKNFPYSIIVDHR